MQRHVDRPFEPRHVGKVDKIAAGRKAREEIGKAATIFCETGPRWEVFTNILVGSVRKKPLVDQPTDDRVGRLERFG